MRKSVNIAIIGMGKWGNHLLENIVRLDALRVRYVCSRHEEDVKVKGDWRIISDDNIILDDNEIDGVIISTQPEKHYNVACKFLKKGLKVFVEKPLTLSFEECAHLADIARKTPPSGIMVGNKFIYSTAINKLKNFISENDIRINAISSRWLKKGGAQKCGIFFDISYHHINLFNYFLGRQFDKLDKYIINKDGSAVASGIIILKYNNLACSIEASYNNHFDFYDHSIRIETSKGTFIVKEKERKMSVYLDNNGLSQLTFRYAEDRETCVEEEMTAFYRWLADGKKPEFGPENDLNIIKFLDSK